MRDRFLTALGIAAPLVLTFAIVLAGLLEPGYSHASQFVSELGAVGASHRKLFSFFGLFLSGLLTVLFALGMLSRVRPRGWFVASSLLVATSGFGRLLAGVFPCDAGCAIEDMSTPATIHAIAGFCALTSGAFAPLLLAAGLRRQERRPLLYLSMGLGSVSVILVFVLFGPGRGLPCVGLIQRFVLAAFYAWVVAVALEIETLQADIVPQARSDPR